MSELTGNALLSYKEYNRLEIRNKYILRQMYLLKCEIKDVESKHEKYVKEFASNNEEMGKLRNDYVRKD